MLKMLGDSAWPIWWSMKFNQIQKTHPGLISIFFSPATPISNKGDINPELHRIPVHTMLISPQQLHKLPPRGGVSHSLSNCQMLHAKIQIENISRKPAWTPPSPCGPTGPSLYCERVPSMPLIPLFQNSLLFHSKEDVVLTVKHV